MTNDSDQKSNNSENKSQYRRLLYLVAPTSKISVRALVLADLLELEVRVHKELNTYFKKDSGLSARDRGKRLLYLFQVDLLPGITGKILESKSNRDNSTVKKVSRPWKIAGYTGVFLLNTGMLFYIFLFALLQTDSRQRAWLQSFILWIVVEILLVSSGIVLFTHVLMPMLIMKDVSKIQQRLLGNLLDYRKSMNKTVTSTEGIDDNTPAVLNAAKYLFASTKVAELFPNLKESKIISKFSTPWPRQSYQHSKDVSKSYSKKFSYIASSVRAVVLFFIGGLLNVPPSLQDTIVQMTTTAAVGYGMLLHIQLYHIFPILVVVPLLIVSVIVHFAIQASKKYARAQLVEGKIFHYMYFFVFKVIEN